jgi:hypothetical protein
MAINPNVVGNQELSEIDLAYIDIWEHHIDFMLTAIRDWKNEEEFHKSVEAKWVSSETEKIEKRTFHRGFLNDILVSLSNHSMEKKQTPKFSYHLICSLS